MREKWLGLSQVPRKAISLLFATNTSTSSSSSKLLLALSSFLHALYLALTPSAQIRSIIVNLTWYARKGFQTDLRLIADNQYNDETQGK